MKNILIVFLLVCGCVFSAEHSSLWGVAGEKWQRGGRLPDFSYAGYHRGEKAIPDVKVAGNVKDFGAVGDGIADDTDAFVAAIAKVNKGAVFVPAGRYKITRVIEISKSGVVLRGAGADKTVLFFPKYLNDILPNWGATTSGRRTSNYSWSGGFVKVRGSFKSKKLSEIAKPAKLGDFSVFVKSADGIKTGQRIEISVRDDSSDSLAGHLYCGDPGKTAKLIGRTKASLVCTVTAVKANRITFDRPLRFDIEPRWHGVVKSFSPTVTEVGIESLCFEFPNTVYKGHFTELGYNAISISRAADCWVRNIRIVDCDSGMFISGRFCTIENIVYESKRKSDRINCIGHHGITLSNDDNHLTGFEFNCRFIHDITVAHCAGNVSSDGKGVDLCFDHHKRAPYSNLFTNIDIGIGSRMFKCGGGAALGRNSAGRETFWNIRSKKPQKWPGGFGPDMMNFVAVETDKKSVKDPDGRWFEAISPDDIQPANIHKAQLKKRLDR